MQQRNVLLLFFRLGYVVHSEKKNTTSKRAAPSARAFWSAFWRKNIIMRELTTEQCEFHVYCTSFRMPSSEIPFFFTRFFFFQDVKSTHPQTRALNEILWSQFTSSAVSSHLHTTHSFNVCISNDREITQKIAKTQRNILLKINYRTHLSTH